MGLASNPEFLREGHAWDDFMNPDRIVIGVEDEQSKALLDTIYRPFNAPIHYVSYSSAEFIKYLSNTLLSTLISFSNEMAMIATRVGRHRCAGGIQNTPRGQALVRKPRRDDDLRVPGLRLRRVLPAQGHCGDRPALHAEHGHVPVMLEGNIQVNEATKDFVVDQITAVVISRQHHRNSRSRLQEWL